MGRGQQMGDIEKSSKDADFRSVATPRRLVIMVLLVVLLPFVITSSYLYYTTPDAATEAMLFFQNRHFPSFSPHKERANVTTAEPASTADANASDSNDTSSIDQSESQLEDPKEGNITAMEAESQGLTNITLEGEGIISIPISGKKKVCDLANGTWVPDPRPPQYTNSSCKFIQGHQNCMKNGRPDTGFLYWKWKPNQCDLPRLDPRAFLTAMTNRSMTFAGDSIARNQFQSLLCLISQVEMPDHTYNAPDDRDNVYVFRTYNFTIAIYWSPYLVEAINKDITWNNRTEAVAHINVDKLDPAWVDRISGVDILQLSTGQWWFKRGLFLEGGKSLGGHICDGWEGCDKEIGFATPYRKAIHTLLHDNIFIPGYNGTTILRTFAPDHFEGGSWDNGGKCVRTEPGGVPISSLTNWMYEIQMEEFQNVTGTLSAPEKNRIKLLDITNLAQIRADGHPDSFMKFQPYSKEFKEKAQKDCLHWCLPGPIDTWNDLLVESLRGEIYGQ